MKKLSVLAKTVSIKVIKLHKKTRKIYSEDRGFVFLDLINTTY